MVADSKVHLIRYTLLQLEQSKVMQSIDILTGWHIWHMDPEIGCGLQSTGQKVRLLIGTAG